MVLATLAACGGSDRARPPAAASSPAPPTTPTTAAPTTTTSTTTTTVVDTTTTAPTSTAGLAGKVIVIDPGHNEGNASHPDEINQPVDAGNHTKACDTTGTTTNDGYSEASFTTDLGNRLAAKLRDAGATVVLTRGPQTPWGPCITERAAIGNDAHADLAISLHADGGPAGGRGYHVIEPGLVEGHNDAIIEPSHAFALVLRDTFGAHTGLPAATYTASNGLDRRTDLGGLNLSKVPKVFIECANMRNAIDAALLTDPAWRDGAAAAIVEAMAVYFA